eukprot:6239905-Lingulodinium_polyedra.AAC.1
MADFDAGAGPEVAGWRSRHWVFVDGITASLPVELLRAGGLRHLHGQWPSAAWSSCQPSAA